jgi:hypothetical protein
MAFEKRENGKDGSRFDKKRKRGRLLPNAVVFRELAFPSKKWENKI